MTNETISVLSTIANATVEAAGTLIPVAYADLATQIIAIAGSVVIMASLITASTKTPDPSTWLGKTYKVIEVLALVVGKVKR